MQFFFLILSELLTGLTLFSFQRIEIKQQIIFYYFSVAFTGPQDGLDNPKEMQKND